MDEVEHREGSHFEPHLSGRPVRMDEGDALEEEPARASEVDPEPAEMSAADEPALKWAGVDRKSVGGFAEHVADRRRQTSGATMLLAMMLAAICAGPFAVLGALLKAIAGQGGFGYLAMIVVGPRTSRWRREDGPAWRR